jgi:hypothetical protein
VIAVNQLNKILEACPVKKPVVKPASEKRNDNDVALALRCLKSLKPSRADNHQEWLEVGMALHSAGCSLDAWDSWSRPSAKYQEGECARRWASFNGDGLTIASLIHWAQQDDPKFETNPKPTPLSAVDAPWAKLVLKQMSTIVAKPIHWLWPNRFPRGMFSMIAGPHGVGKSFFSLGMSAIISQGYDWPDCPNSNGKGSVIYFTDEESLEYAVRPRLDACGADVTKIFAYDSILLSDGQTGHFDITKALDLLDTVLEAMPDCQAVFFDCLIGFLGKTDGNSNADVRQALTPLVKLAERWNVAIIGISHFNKKIDLEARDRVIGSVAFGAVSRSVWAVALDKESMSENPARLVLPLKTNYSKDATGLRYSIIDGGVVFQKDQIVAPDVDKALERKSGREAKGGDAAAEWLENYLDGDVDRPVKELLENAAKAGFKEFVIKAASKKIGVRKWQSGFHGVWMWTMRQRGRDGE